MQNILILSAGRRVELVQSFSVELQRRIPDASVFAADMNPDLSAACHVAEGKYEVPKVGAMDYVDKLIELCLMLKVGFVVPTIDTELIPLSFERNRFADNGILLIISSPEMIALCRDKRKTAHLFEGIGVSYPKIYSRNAISFPCFAKPFNGSCSIGAVPVTTPDQLTESMLVDENLIFQQLIDSSFSEFTVDAYYDRNGKLCCLVPRERIEVRAGEVSKGVTRKHQVYDYLLPRLSLLPGARGCITLQLFAKPEEGQFYALEINPRFGGGYPLSYSAGANYPGWLIDEYLLGLDVFFYEDWKSDLMMLRYDAKVLVHG
ncbi:MAG: ATP-grasp domain-containing protein [Chlorobiaceae bacterium]|nr:ATP-grasp domain-containing protein [Chlorobiaceae bacterium]